MELDRRKKVDCRIAIGCTLLIWIHNNTIDPSLILLLSLIVATFMISADSCYVAKFKSPIYWIKLLLLPQRFIKPYNLKCRVAPASNQSIDISEIAADVWRQLIKMEGGLRQSRLKIRKRRHVYSCPDWIIIVVRGRCWADKPHPSWYDTGRLQSYFGVPPCYVIKLSTICNRFFQGQSTKRHLLY